MTKIDLEKMLIEMYSAFDVIIDTMIENGLITEEKFRQLKQRAEEKETEKFYNAMCGNYLGKSGLILQDLTKNKGEER